MPARSNRLGIALGLLVSLVAGSSAAAGWHTIETRHFYVHYEDGYAELAADLVARAETSWAEVADALEHRPEGKTHLIVQDAQDLANAAVDPLFHNQIVLFPVFPLPAQGMISGLAPRADDWLDLLFTHEFTHVVHLDMHTGQAEALRELFGRVPFLAMPIAVAPPFFTEGYAVYQESRLQRGRGGSAYFDMFLRAAVDAHALPDLSQVVGFYPLDEWVPPTGPYLYGYAFLSYLAEVYGDEVLHEVNAILASMPGLMSGAIAQVTDRSIDRLWRDFVRATTRKYEAQIEALRAEGPWREPEPIEVAGDYALAPSVSPGGDRIAYAAGGHVAPALRLYDVQAGEEHHLAAIDVTQTGRIAWHPDGRRLVYAGLGYTGGRLVSDLYEIDVETGRRRRLTRGERAFAPDYDPAGERIAYVRRQADATELVVLDSDSGRREVVLDGDAGVQVLGAAWAPDGDRIAAVLWSPGGVTGVYLVTPSGGTPVPLVRSIALYQHPSWSRDGRYVLFDSDRSGVFNLYAYDVRDGELWQLTHTKTGVFSPSPGPGWIAALHYTAGGYDLARLPWDPTDWARVEGPYVEPLPAVDRPPPPEFDGPVPYDAGRTLAPTFWWPIVNDYAGESHLGFLTGGRDVLGTVQYVVQVTQGLRSGWHAFEAELGYGPGSDGNWFLGASASRRLAIDAEESPPQWVVEDEAGIDFLYRFPRMDGTDLLDLSVSAARQGSLGVPVTDPVLVAYRAAWEHVRTFGRGSVQGLRGHTLEAGVTNQGADTAWGRLSLRTERDWAGRSGLSGVLTLGAGDPDMIELGGSIGPFALRGWSRGGLRGSYVARLSLEGRLRLSAVQHGVADQPYFFGDLSLHPFLDAGAAWTSHAAEGRVGGGAGVELGLTNYLGYGSAPIDLRLGIVEPLGRKSPAIIYFRLGSNF